MLSFTNLREAAWLEALSSTNVAPSGGRRGVMLYSVSGAEAGGEAGAEVGVDGDGKRGGVKGRGENGGGGLCAQSVLASLETPPK